MRTILSYDGSFDGFLSCIFFIYEYKLKDVAIQKNTLDNENLFDAVEEITTDLQKSNRVWNKLKKISKKKGLSLLYKAHLSELPQSDMLMLDFIKLIIDGETGMENDYSNAITLQLSKISKMVHREKHRMDAFIRFRETKEGIYFAIIAPDFNVLPLNASHFKSRYADQQWIIYDLKRKYGLYYDLEKVSIIQLEDLMELISHENDQDFFSEEESYFESLWKNYFKSTNIESRKNMQLHIKHVPKRYWKYLSEKAPQ